MRSRIEKMTGAKVASRLWMGTFHSIFRRILNAHVDRIGFKPGFTTVSYTHLTLPTKLEV